MDSLGKIKLYRADCMDIMRDMPDRAFDLAIVDPPYGIGGDSAHAGRLSRGAGKLKGRALQKKIGTPWDVAPTDEYFAQLFRVSKNQIIFGGNYFALPRCRCFVVWDKCQPWENFSQVEYAWTSFDYPAPLFRFDNRTTDKIHPTQKPVALYKWLLWKFAKQGDRILDTHLGSGSSAIAAHDGGFEFVGIELDADYYIAAKQRIATYQLQRNLF